VVPNPNESRQTFEMMVDGLVALAGCIPQMYGHQNRLGVAQTDLDNARQPYHPLSCHQS
jgi:hypothetical protein